MTRRTLAAMLSLVLLAALWITAVLVPVPYVTYSPGVTVDVLAKEDGQEIVEVAGHKTYRDGGQLRMTTVYVTQPEARVNLFEVLRAWVSRDDAVYPYSAVYGEGETTEDSRTESAIQMVSSQDAAIAVALRKLGYDLKETTEVLSVADGTPAEGEFEVRDQITAVDGTAVSSPDEVVKAVRSSAAGEPVTFSVRRDGKEQTLEVTPAEVDGTPQVGVSLGLGYDFPFQVKVGIPDTIGGPSAGLMFSLAIYDTLTPGSLTDDETVAGTGTIDDKGEVGPIGGIQQKIVAAQQADAKLFLVPADNCADALGAPDEGMRLVKVTTFDDALSSVQAWTKDDDVALPSCEAS